MRALAADTERALREVIDDLALPWSVDRRTGDTASAARARQLARPPTALITTPESLSLLLTQPNGERLFADLRCVVVDEWHELMGNKRGVQTELCLARLRRLRPGLRTWGLSATLGNLDTALAALLGEEKKSTDFTDSTDYSFESVKSVESVDSSSGVLVQGHMPKAIVIDTLIPERVDRFPWAGHMGLKMLPAVAAAVAEGRSALVFTNTRNQAETWYQALLAERPEWAGEIALHHGSLSADARRWVEDGLRAGSLRCVVATSSLDLGVDFSPVDRVLQVGSPKGVARLFQRAGRSGHQPGATSRVTCVPAHAFELVEAAAARDALRDGRLEGREPVERPLDVLVQHLVTVALGSGFDADGNAGRGTHRLRLSRPERRRVALGARLRGAGGRGAGGLPGIPPRDARRWPLPRHREGDRHPPPPVRRHHRRRVVDRRQVPERNSPGQHSGVVHQPPEAGQHLRLRRQEAGVSARARPDGLRQAGQPAQGGVIPAWTGTSLPISPELGAAVRRKLAEARDGVYDGPEMVAVQPVLELQQKWSALPGADELLVERLATREGRTRYSHLFVYPFAGKLVHQGLAALAAYRLSRVRPITFTLTANDYGFELLAPERDAFADLDVLRPAEHRQPAGRHRRRAERERDGPAPVPRDRPRGRAGVPGLPRTAAEGAPLAGLVQYALRSFPQVRRRQPAAGSGPPRGAQPPVGAEPLAADAGAADRAARRGQGHAPPVAAVLPPAGRAVAGQHPHERVAGRAGAQDDGLGRERSVTRSAGC
jgi:ATP-dependent Lhr-like helicase